MISERIITQISIINEVKITMLIIVLFNKFLLFVLLSVITSSNNKFLKNYRTSKGVMKCKVTALNWIIEFYFNVDKQYMD
jgi:hypothetical protein